MNSMKDSIFRWSLAVMCPDCRSLLDSTRQNPTHLAHPQNFRRVGEWDSNGYARCPRLDCRTTWCRGEDGRLLPVEMALKTRPAAKPMTRDESPEDRRRKYLSSKLLLLDSKGRPYAPNHIPRTERIFYAVVSAILLVYGVVGLWIDDLYLPGRRTEGVHLHGVPAWVMFAAFLCACANMLSVIVDHFDRRNNEINYKLFARLTAIAGWSIFGFASILWLIAPLR